MALAVTDSEGVLVGLLTRQNLAEMMIIKTMRPDWRFPSGLSKDGARRFGVHLNASQA